MAVIDRSKFDVELRNSIQDTYLNKRRSLLASLWI